MHTVTVDYPITLLCISKLSPVQQAWNTKQDGTIKGIMSPIGIGQHTTRMLPDETAKQLHL